MNAPDPFEQRLRRQALRRVPTAWREEILTRATAAAEVSQRTGSPGELTSAASLWLRLRELLWPCPQAWAGLAAVWVVMLALSLATREPVTTTANMRPTMPPSPQLRQMLKEQRQMLVELGGVAEQFQAQRPETVPPQPRSQLQLPLLNT